MKKLLIISAIFLVSLSGFSQKTSIDVINKIQTIISNATFQTVVGKNAVPVDSTMLKLFVELRDLQVKEIRNTVEPKKLAYVPLSFCFVCSCRNCGCLQNAGNGNCTFFPGFCSGPCGCCGQSNWSLWVMSCDGGMCGGQQGAN